MHFKSLDIFARLIQMIVNVCVRSENMIHYSFGKLSFQDLGVSSGLCGFGGFPFWLPLHIDWVIMKCIVLWHVMQSCCGSKEKT